MPRKPAHPCNYPGCPNLTAGRYCPEHQKQVNHNYEKYQRNKESKKNYRGSWQVLRKRFLSSHPWCEECLKEQGIYTPASQVHHRLPIREGGTNDEENLEALCRSCHSRIHAKRGDRFGR